MIQRLMMAASVGVLVLGAAACDASGLASDGDSSGVVGTTATTAATTTVAPTTTVAATTTTVAPTTTVAATTTTTFATNPTPPPTPAPTTTAASQGGQGQGGQGQGGQGQGQGAQGSSAVPTVDSNPANAVYTPSVKPSTIYLSGDSSNIVTGLRWAGWDGRGATGYGTVNIEGCVPDCASGSQTPTPVTIYLNNPVNGKFTLLTENIQGMASQNIAIPTS